MAEGKYIVMWRALAWATGVFLLVNLAFLGWAGSLLISLKDKDAIHDTEIKSIKDQYAPLVVGLDSWKQSVSAVREAMAKLPNDYPPQWFQDKVKRMEADLQSCTAIVTANQSAMARIEAKVEAVAAQLGALLLPGKHGLGGNGSE